MEFSLRQAKYTNPESEIILLGDDSNNRFPSVEHVNIKNYFRGAKEFAKIYKHFSTNPYHYELFCFQRWFILKEFMETKNHTNIFVFDSDVLLYSNINELKNTIFPNNNIAIVMHSSLQMSAEFSLWNIENLIDFCKYLKDRYCDSDMVKQMKDTFRDVTQSKRLGGQSDMTAIGNYFGKHFNDKVANLIEVKNDSVFDTHINNPQDYEFKLGKKAFTWHKNIPYCYNKTLKKNIKFHCIHFQGPAKYMMAKCYTGPNFKGKTILSIKFFFLNVLAFWYKTLRIRYRFAFLFRFFFNLRHKKSKKNF